MRHMKRKAFLILSFFLGIFLAFSLPLFSTIYYVDYTTGDDGDSGLTEELAWKTINKVNTSSFNAGDSILFKRGETWREQLTVPSSGSSGSPITFGAYGSGADPIIDNRSLLDTSGNWSELAEDFTSRATCESFYDFENNGDLGEDDQGQIAMTNSGVTQSADVPSGTYAGPSSGKSGDFEQGDPDVMTATHAISSEVDDLTAITAFAWIKLEGTPGEEWIFSKTASTGWDGWFVALNTGGNAYFAFGNGNFVNLSGLTWNTATWYFIAFTYDGSNMRFYRGTEGALAAQLGSDSAAAGRTASTADEFAIGKRWDDQKYFDGLITEAAVFSEALSLKELQSIQEYGIEGNSTLYKWYHDSIDRVRYCWLDENLETVAADVASVNATNKYYYDSGATRLYVYATSNPATAYTSPGVLVSEEYISCLIDAKNYITLENINFRGGYNDAIRVKGASTNIIVDTCTFGKLNNGIKFSNDTPASEGPFTDIQISDCTITYDQADLKAGDGIRLHEAQTGTISGCIFTDVYHSGVHIGHDDATWDACTDITIENNTFQWSASSYYGRAFDIEGLDDGCTGCIIRYNYIQDQPTNSKICANDNYVYYNIWDGGQLNGYLAGRSRGFKFEAYGPYCCHDNFFYNNIIYGSYEEGLYFDGTSGATYNVVDNTIKNNIIMNCDSAGSNIQVCYENETETGNQVVTNNCLYVSGVSDLVNFKTTAYTVAEAETNVTGWASNIQSDPLFIDAAGANFSLQSTSPCINAGTDVGLTQDYEKKGIRHAPDIGAYEEQTNVLFWGAGVFIVGLFGMVLFREKIIGVSKI